MSWSISYKALTMTSPTFMTLIGHGLPVYASNSSGGSNAATKAVDGTDYFNSWWSTGCPVTLDIDISSVVAGIFSDSGGYKGLVYAFGTNDQALEPSLVSNSEAHIPGNYTIEVNSGAGGGSSPGSGWTTAVTVTGNIYSRRAHILDVTGINWVRLNVTQAADGSSTGPRLHTDLWNGNGAINSAHTSFNAGWLMIGDSIYANGMMWENPGGDSGDTPLGNIVQVATGHWPLQFCAGFPGFKTSDLTAYTDAFVASFPGKYVQIGLGTNDAGANSSTVFAANLRTMCDSIQAVNKIAVVDTIPWCSDARIAYIPALNQKIADLITADPTILAGNDRWTYMNNNQGQISGDGVHPASAGYAGLRAQQGARMAAIGSGA